MHRLRRIDPCMGPVAIELRGPAQASRERYEAILRAEVSFEHKASALIFSREVWERPIAGADATLRAILERHGLHLAARAPSPALVDHARNLLAAMIGEGLADIANLARRLGMSPRTLQPKLEAEGLAYSELLDQARRELACAYMADPALSVDEIAALTGNSEISSFSRAFRRWTGESPLRYRRGRQGG